MPESMWLGALAEKTADFSLFERSFLQKKRDEKERLRENKPTTILINAYV